MYWDYKLYIEYHLTAITNKFVLLFSKDWHFMKISISFTLLLRTPFRDLYVCTCVPHPTATLIGLFRRFLRIWYARVIYFAHCSNDSSITCCTLSSPRHRTQNRIYARISKDNDRSRTPTNAASICAAVTCTLPRLPSLCPESIKKSTKLLLFADRNNYTPY